MRSEILLALIKTEVEDSLESLFAPSKRGPRGYKGPQGPRGDTGQGFDVSANLDLIKNLVTESALKFSDLSEEEVEKITGPRGSRGLQGPVGKNFIFAEHEEHIDILIREEVERLKTSLKLTFDDLSDKEKESLSGKRGPRGQRGPKGQDFVFEDHKEFFNSLRLRFSDLSDEEVDSLKLKFNSLTNEEREAISLKFSSLTDEEVAKIRGPRGPKGQKGRTGDLGESGEKGLQGLVGPRGIKGLPGLPGPIGVKGLQGFQGAPGEDAPLIIDIKAEQDDDRFKFEFTFSNGVTLFTDWIDIPQRDNHFIVGGGLVSGGDGGTGVDAPVVTAIDTERVDDTIRFVFTFDDLSTLATDYVALVPGPAGVDGTNGIDGINGTNGIDGTNGTNGIDGIDGVDGSSSILMDCEANVFVGAAVKVNKVNEVASNMDDWTLLGDVLVMTYTTYDEVLALAQANSMTNSNSVGVCDSKPTSITCNLIAFGATSDNYLGLDVDETYYLSDTVAGRIVAEASRPTADGSVILKMGQALRDSSLLVNRGERKEIGVAPDLHKKVATKILTIDHKTDTVMDELTYINLVIGRWYEVYGEFAFSLNAGTTANRLYVNAFTGGAYISQSYIRILEATDSSEDSLVATINARFQAVGTTVTFVPGFASAGSYIRGQGDRKETYVQLEERPDLVATTIWD